KEVLQNRDFREERNAFTTFGRGLEADLKNLQRNTHFEQGRGHFFATANGLIDGTSEFGFVLKEEFSVRLCDLGFYLQAGKAPIDRCDDCRSLDTNILIR